jgi:hypothetical protein
VKIEVVPASLLHAPVVAAGLRQADRASIARSAQALRRRLTPLGEIRTGIDKSAIAWAMLIDGRPEAVGGAVNAPGEPATGIPWLLATDEFERRPIAAFRLTVRFRDQLLQRYRLLRNFVWADDDARISHLRRLGFAISDPQIVGGLLVRMFEGGRQCAR